jgi:phosphatidylglycerophosphatase A
MTQVCKNNSLWNFVNIVVTFFGVGNLKFCPGTWGSIATLPLWIFINFILLITGVTYSVVNTLLIWLLIIISLFFLGAWASDIYMKQNKRHDPKEIVIDEVVGQLITYVITIVSFIFSYYFKKSVILLNNFNSSWYVFLFLIILLIIPIVFFRLFDIIKPWFIGRIDKHRIDGYGVMLDDVLAGLIAGIFSSICVIIFL